MDMDFYNRDICCCFTGHRPDKLDRPPEEVKEWLEIQIRHACRKGFSVFITGMAAGVDLWAGEIVGSLKREDRGLRLIAVEPYMGFTYGMREPWKTVGESVLGIADEKVLLSAHYWRGVFQKRNKWMVDHSGLVIAYFNGTPGGTKNTVDYAHKRHVRVIVPMMR